jgi:hypothetical protein
LVRAPGNTHEFTATGDFAVASDNLPESKHGRAGTDAKPGREYFMARAAHEILECAGLEAKNIQVFGAGLSRDHAHIAREYPRAQVCVCDLANFQKAGNFVGMDDPRRFDIMIACEVVEHFTDLPANFITLLSKLSTNGLAVLSTNIADGTPLADLEYPYIPGHTAYYSGRAMKMLAHRVDPAFHVDFRLPQAATAQLGLRKRYIFVYRDPRIASGIAEYFSLHAFAPSEPSIPLSFPVKCWHLLRGR